MTNAELVREINRMIRGVALNYPDGIRAIRAQLDAVDPPKPDGFAGIPIREDPTMPRDMIALESETERVAVQVSTLEGTASAGPLKLPEVPWNRPVEQPKRGPGRPKGSKNRKPGDAV